MFSNSMIEGKKQIPRFARNDHLKDSAMRWRGYKCKDKDPGFSLSQE